MATMTNSSLATLTPSELQTVSGGLVQLVGLFLLGTALVGKIAVAEKESRRSMPRFGP